MKIIELMFDGVLTECLVQLDAAGEIVCTARNGRFHKFPNDDAFEDYVKAHNEDNSTVPVYAAEVEAAANELDEWLDKPEVEEVADETAGEN